MDTAAYLNYRKSTAFDIRLQELKKLASTLQYPDDALMKIQELTKEKEDWLKSLNEQEAKNVQDFGTILEKKKLSPEESLIKDKIVTIVKNQMASGKTINKPLDIAQEHRAFLTGDPTRDIAYLENQIPDHIFRVRNGNVEGKHKDAKDFNVIDPSMDYVTSMTTPMSEKTKEIAMDTTADIATEGVKGTLTAGGAGVGKTLGTGIGYGVTRHPMGGRLGGLIGGTLGGAATSVASELGHQFVKDQIGMPHGGESELLKRALYGGVESLLPSGKATQKGQRLIQGMAGTSLRGGATKQATEAIVNKLREPLLAGAEGVFRKISAVAGGVPEDSLFRYAAQYDQLKALEKAGKLSDWEKRTLHDLQIKLDDIAQSYGDYSHGITLGKLEEAGPVDLSKALDALDTERNGLMQSYQRTGDTNYLDAAKQIDDIRSERFPAPNDTYKEFSAMGAYDLEKSLDKAIDYNAAVTKDGDFLLKGVRDSINSTFPDSVHNALLDYRNFRGVRGELNKAGITRPYKRSTDPSLVRKESDDFIATTERDPSIFKEKAIKNLQTPFGSRETSLPFPTDDSIEDALKKITMPRTKEAIQNLAGFQDHLKKIDPNIPLGPTNDAISKYNELLTSKEWMGPRLDVGKSNTARRWLSSFPASYAGYHAARGMGADFPIAVGAGALTGMGTRLGLSDAAHKAGIGLSKSLQNASNIPRKVPSFEGGLKEIAKRMLDPSTALPLLGKGSAKTMSVLGSGYGRRQFPEAITNYEELIEAVKPLIEGANSQYKETFENKMYEQHYGNGMTSSEGDKVKVKSGSLDARKPYMKDMYDMKPPMPAASKPMDSAGMTDKVAADVAVDPDMGSKHYGKGNPYKKKAKAKFKSFQDLRDYAAKMGA